MLGKYSNYTGLSSIFECQDCPNGFYCDSYGLSAPTAICNEGYICKFGSNSSSPTDGTTGFVCPKGHFCSNGTLDPTPCPVSKYNPYYGAVDEFGCLSCLAGHFCDKSGSSNVTGECDPSFYCNAGSSTNRPTNVLEGGLCPLGLYCLSGSSQGIPCASGTYNPAIGQSSCFSCLAGYYCPLLGSFNLTDCPIGFFCPQGSSTPAPCLPGTFGNRPNLRNASECVVCPVGSYCAGVNLTTSTDLCPAGFFCNYGTSISIPNGTFPFSGPCPEGFYCPKGTLFPIQCPPSTYRPITGGMDISDCLICPSGSYCATPGLAFVSGLCSPGYYCPEGQSLSNPYPCIPGTYCAAGSSFPISCSAGTYQSQFSQSSCLSCPSGNFCTPNSTTPEICPIKYFCPANSHFPTICPNGTYSNVIGLMDATQCLSCPTSFYCQYGSIVGNCSAGYWCVSANSVATPSGNVDILLSNGIYLNVIGGPCPSGAYCPAATTSPIPCPTGEVRALPGATSVLGCSICPSGYKCFAGNPVPQPCPLGYYCPGSNTDAIPCPIGTYSSTFYNSNITSCLPCPEGYLCESYGLSDYLPFSCPVGHFCPQGVANSVPCPAGTYRSSTGGKNASDCSVCPVGKFCISGSALFSQCPSGTFCEGGNAIPQACFAGSYCPPDSYFQIGCPLGYYCPMNSSSPIVCPIGTYCPYNSSGPSLCPFGTMAITSVPVRDTVTSSCQVCPPGTYGADAYRLSCSPCTEGYVCLGNTKSATPVTDDDNGYICSAGYYCPVASYQQIPCPAGYYNGVIGSSNFSACIICPKNTFSSVAGQAACTPCGASAYSAGGTSVCSCVGEFRSYQSFDGSCLCIPGYQYFDETGAYNTGDSPKSCIPITYSQCDTGLSRNSLGVCVSAVSSICSSVCGNQGGGTFNIAIGICECNDAKTPLDQVCNSTCRLSAPQVSLNSNGQIIITSNDGSSSLISFDESNGFFGKLNPCPNSTGSCKIYTVISDVDGQKGIYDPGSALRSMTGLPTLSSFHNRKIENQKFNSPPSNRLYDLSVSTSVPGYLYPTLCLKQGDACIFDISVDYTHYPIYQKDNFLNSNPNFDYSLFRKLASQIQSNSSIPQLFAFSFDDIGTYVFADAADVTKTTTIVVVASSSQCTTGGIVGTSSDNLILLGVSSNSKLTLDPDLKVIAYLFVVFIGVALMISFFSRFQQQKKVSLSTSLSIDQSMMGSFGIANEFLELYKKLDEQKLFHKNHAERSKGDMVAFSHRLTAETEQVKALLLMKLVNFNDGNSQYQSAEQRQLVAIETAEKLLWSEISTRKMFRNRISSHEEEIWTFVLSLQSLFNSIEEKKTISEDEVSKWLSLCRQINDDLSLVSDIFIDERKRRGFFHDQSDMMGGPEIYSTLSFNDEREFKSQDSCISLYKILGNGLADLSSRYNNKLAEYQIRKSELQLSNSDHIANSKSSIISIQNLDNQFDKSLLSLIGDSNVLIKEFMHTFISNRDSLYASRSAVSDSQIKAINLINASKNKLQSEAIKVSTKKSKTKILLDPMLEGLHPDLQRALCSLFQQLGIIEKSVENGQLKLTLEPEASIAETLDISSPSVMPLSSIGSMPASVLTNPVNSSYNFNIDSIKDQIFGIAQATGLSNEQLMAALFGENHNLNNKKVQISDNVAENIDNSDFSKKSVKIPKVSPDSFSAIGPVCYNIATLFNIEQEIQASELLISKSSTDIPVNDEDVKLRSIQSGLVCAVDASRTRFLSHIDDLALEFNCSTLSDLQKEAVNKGKYELNVLQSKLKQESLDLETELLLQEKDVVNRDSDNIDSLRQQFQIQLTEIQGSRPANLNLTDLELKSFEEARDLRIKHLESKYDSEIQNSENLSKENLILLRNRHQLQRDILRQKHEVKLNDQIIIFNALQDKMKTVQNSKISSVVIPEFAEEINKSIELQSLLKEHSRSLSNIEQKHFEELNQATDSSRNSKSAAEQNIKRKLLEKRDILLSSVHHKMQNEIAANSSNPELIDTISQKYKIEMDLIASSTDSEIFDQLKAFDVQFTNEQNHKLLELKRKQQISLIKELEFQIKNELVTKISLIVIREKELVLQLCNKENRHEAKYIIESITSNRFSLERSNLLSIHWKTIIDAINKEFVSSKNRVAKFRAELYTKVSSKDINI